MTKASKAFGKRVQDFFDNADTQTYMNELVHSIHANQRDLVEAKRGSQGGTFGHPKLAMFFARWLDVKRKALMVSRTGVMNRICGINPQPGMRCAAVRA